MSMEIYDPTYETEKRRIEYAPRPTSLAGLRIGLVDNTKHNSDQLLLRIAGILEQEHGAATHMIRRKTSAGARPHDAIVEEFRRDCDIVIAGIGD